MQGDSRLACDTKCGADTLPAYSPQWSSVREDERRLPRIDLGLAARVTLTQERNLGGRGRYRDFGQFSYHSFCKLRLGEVSEHESRFVQLGLKGLGSGDVGITFSPSLTEILCGEARGVSTRFRIVGLAVESGWAGT